MRAKQSIADLDTVGSGKETSYLITERGQFYGLDLMCFKDNAGSFEPMSMAEMTADIDYVEVIIKAVGVGKDPIFKMSPERMFEFVDWSTGHKTDHVLHGIFPVPLTRDRIPNSRVPGVTLPEDSALGIGTLDVKKFIVKVKFKTHGGFLCNKITLKADMDEELNLNLNTYPVLLYSEHEILTAGIKPVRDLPSQIGGAGLLSVHMTEGNATVNEINKVKLGSKVLLEGIDATEHDRMAHRARRIPQAGVWHFDFQRFDSYLPLGTNAELHVSMDYEVAPDSFDIVVDMIKGLG